MVYFSKKRLGRLVAAGALTAGLAMGSAVQAQNSVSLAQGVDPESLDPAYDTLISSVGVMMNIYDSLIWRDAKGVLVPGLAESWTFPTSTQMRLKLRRGVKWHDGSDFSADDVVFTFDRIFGKGKDAVPLLSSLKGFVDHMEKVDDNTVILHMPKPLATITPTLVRIPILPKKAFNEMGEQAFGQAPVGTGPFKFVQWDKNQQIVMDAFGDHWRGRPQIDRYVVKPIPEDFARYASLKNGEVDIIANLTAERAKEIDALPSLQWKGVHSVRNMFVGLNTRKKPFDDLRVRQAVNHAVDVEALVEVVLGGHAFVNPSVCTETLFGWSKVAPYAYDPAKAKALLAEAGYPNGLEVTMLGPVGRYTQDKEIQEAIAGMLSAVGIRVTHNQPEWAEFIKQWRAENFPMYFIGTGNQVLDCDQHMGYRIDGKRYNKYYQSDAVDALIRKEEVSHDPEERKRLFAEIHQIVRDDAPWIFLYDQKDLYGMSARLDWQPRPDEMVWAFEIKSK